MIGQTLLPRPLKITSLPEGYNLDQTCSIICQSPGGSGAGERLASLLAGEWGLKLPVRQEKTGGDHVLLVARQNDVESLYRLAGQAAGPFQAEEYRLQVNREGAIVRAGTFRGLLWGAMTLRQLVFKQADSLFIRGVEIVDRPRYDMRGFMIDSGRSPNSMAKLKRIIRICSSFKLNTLLFREGDDEMNAVRYNTNKLGSENPFAFAIEELGELVAYAREHGIALVTEVESLGHSTAKGVHYPELVSGGFAEKYAGVGTHTRKSHLAPCDPRTFALLESIYDEIFAVLREPFIHLGLDEVRLPASEQQRHMEQLLPIVFRCAERHRVEALPIVWSDAPETPDKYQGRVHRCLWGYGNEGNVGPDNGHLAAQAIEQLSRPGCGQPVIMAGGSASGHTPYSKTPYEAAYRNLAQWAQWGNRLDNHMGLLAVQWGGNMIDAWLPDFLAAADFGWTPPAVLPPYEVLHERIKGHLSRLADASHPPPDLVDRPAWDAIWLKADQWDSEVLARPDRGG